MLVGILGGGQLARMIALAGYPLGLDFLVLDPAPSACAGAVCEQLVGAYDDRALLAQLAQRAAVVTYEFENVPPASARYLAERLPLSPPARALEVSADRLLEKNLFVELGIPTPRYVPVDAATAVERALATTGLPAVLKTRREGYDGKGQFVIERADQCAAAWAALGPAPKIVEEFVPFSREVSVIAVRGASGVTVFYPLSENVHRGGILRFSIARTQDPLAAAACAHAQRLLEALDYVGVLALELFDVDGRLFANEFAPRVHNSGHWTIEGSETSQFENHLRAILGLGLGATSPVGHAAMINLVGAAPEPAAVLSHSCAHLHLYGKEPRPGRKLGHITVRAPSASALQSTIAALAELPGVDTASTQLAGRRPSPPISSPRSAR